MRKAAVAFLAAAFTLTACGDAEPDVSTQDTNPQPSPQRVCEQLFDERNGDDTTSLAYRILKTGVDLHGSASSAPQHIRDGREYLASLYEIYSIAPKEYRHPLVILQKPYEHLISTYDAGQEEYVWNTTGFNDAVTDLAELCTDDGHSVRESWLSASEVGPSVSWSELRSTYAPQLHDCLNGEAWQGPILESACHRLNRDTVESLESQASNLTPSEHKDELLRVIGIYNEADQQWQDSDEACNADGSPACEAWATMVIGVMRIQQLLAAAPVSNP